MILHPAIADYIFRKTRPVYTENELAAKLRGEEIWRWVVGAEGYYQVSDWGRVRSVERKSRQWNGSCFCLRTIKQRILRPDSNQGKYFVTLHKDGVGETVGVAELVLTAFVCPRPEGLEVCHFPDINRANNRVENIRWDTSKANQCDKKVHGTTTLGKVVNPGEENGGAKLTDEKVREIRQLFATGRYRQSILCKVYGIGAPQMHEIVKGKAWRHVI